MVELHLHYYHWAPCGEESLLTGGTAPLHLPVQSCCSGFRLSCAGGAPRAAPVSTTTAVLCQERELGLWDSMAFDVFCSQIMKVLQLSNTNIGFPVRLGGCSGGSWFSMETTSCRRDSIPAGSQRTLVLQTVFWGFWSIFLTAFPGKLQWQSGLAEKRSEAYRLWHYAIGANPLKCTHPWSRGGNQHMHSKANNSWEEGRNLVKVTRWHTDVWQHFFQLRNTSAFFLLQYMCFILNK